jgi:hypothetical protein
MADDPLTVGTVFRRVCMKLRIGFARAVVVLALIFSVDLLIASAQQRALTADQSQVVSTVSAIFSAAELDDLTKFHAVVAPGFYIYDAGARFDGDTIMALIKAEHAKGRKYKWNVTEPDVHVVGDTAWVAYVNKGAVTDASGTVDERWLESAFLERSGGAWKIVFMHSTVVPTAAARTAPVSKP